jgi:hypothetical protein
MSPAAISKTNPKSFEKKMIGSFFCWYSTIFIFEFIQHVAMNG